MNVSSDGPYLLALLYLSETPRSRGAALAPVMAMLLERLDVARVQLVVDREDDLDPEAEALAEAEAEAYGVPADRSALATACADPATLAVTALDTSPGARTARVQVGARLRFATGIRADEQAPRAVHAIVAVGPGGTSLADAGVAVAAWIEACVDRLDVLHGGVTVLPSYAEAVVEATLVGLDLPPDADARWRYDDHRRRALWSHARRLYPWTVLGPALAVAATPGAARDHGAAAVEERGGAVIVRAVADPAAGLEPGFAARTAALRRWLWPYTVQNPVDADLGRATVVMSTASKLIIESPDLGRRILQVGVPELAKGETVAVAFPGVGDRLVVQVPGAGQRSRTLVFDAGGHVVDDYTLRGGGRTLRS